jgi:hypothetical protein
MKNDDDLVQKLKDVFESVSSGPLGSEYPTEAVPIGTFVRSHRFNRLGVVTDAFYGDLDLNNTKIIIYTILLIPKTDFKGISIQRKEKYYLTNEYEYEVTAFLMIKPVNLKKLSFILGENFHES